MFEWFHDKELRREFEENLLAQLDSLYNFAYRLTQNREEANDLVQEASLRGYRYFHQFEPGSNFKGWIFAILRNIFINQYRKKHKEPTLVNYEDMEEFISVPEATGVTEEIFSESVQKSVDELPEELRTVIILFYLEGLSYKEIAQIIHCPIGTVMSRLFMSRQLMKKKLILLTGKES